LRRKKRLQAMVMVTEIGKEIRRGRVQERRM
jgi:hypothetical protein